MIFRTLSQAACNRISFLLLIILGAGMSIGIAINAGTGWDFANFYDAGHKIRAGQIQDLYDATAPIEGQAPQGQMPYYGVPLSAVVFSALAWLSPARALVAFKLQNTAALVLALALLYRWNIPLALKSGLHVSQYRVIFLTATLLFQPFWTIYRVGGQTTPTLFLGFVLALWCFTAGRLFAAALCLVVVIAIKPAFIFTLAVLALFGGVRLFLYTAVSGLTAAALSIFSMGWTIHQRFLAHITETKISPWIYNSSLSVFADNLSAIAGQSVTLRATGTAVRLLAAGLVVAALWSGWRQIAPVASKRHWLFLNATVIGLLLMPIVWEHYLSVLFIPIAYLLAVLPRLHAPERSLIFLVCGFCFTQNLILVLALDNWLRPQSLWGLSLAALFKSAPLILFTVLLWRHRAQVIATYEPTFSKLEMSVSA